MAIIKEGMKVADWHDSINRYIMSNKFFISLCVFIVDIMAVLLHLIYGQQLYDRCFV